MWEVFKNWIFDVVQFFFNICGDWGLAIIIITIIFRLLLMPLMHSQTKSNYATQKIQPQITAIQENFADDPVRMQEEIQKLYAETKFNPMAGCLPMLLQMPIFIALFQVLQEMGERVADSSTYCFYWLVPDLVLTPNQALSEGFGTFVPYLILLAIFAGATFLPSFITSMKAKDSPSRTTTLVTAVIMTIMMVFIGWGTPAGVLLFWGTSSLLGIAQQQISQAILKHQDEKAEAEEVVVEKPVEVNVVRKKKKPRPKKKH